ncbi:uncharacterized protein LOC141655628 [Silene latifolia]|uniref:uncharacterized protein LOC141655628 n=1 Tax=Silene latifolia TaxID=37657 RepID=UPI003D77FFB0
MKERASYKMGSERGKYKMSVELALQREMAYRDKLQAFQLKKETASQNCLSSPSQTLWPGYSSRVPKTPSVPPSQPKPRLHPSSPTLSPSPTGQLHPKPQSLISPKPFIGQRPTLPPKPFSLPPKPTFQSSGLYRPTTPMPKPVPWTPKLPPINPTLVPRPISTTAPTPTQMPKPAPRSPPPKLPPRNPTVVLRPLSSPISSSKHTTLRPTPTPSHKRKGTFDEQLEPSRSGKIRKLFCDVCKVHCTSTNNLQMHLMGQKHKSKVQKRENKEKGIEEMEVGDPKLYCQLCDIWCMNEFCLKQHLIGKNHINKVYVGERQKGSG